MTGLAVYALVSLGLGAWLPGLTLGDRRSIGAVLFGGYAVMLTVLFLLQAVIGAGLGVTFWILAAVALTGIVRLGWRYRGSPREIALHPAIVLPVAAGILIALRGDIDYLPYAVDEFTNWIGAAKDIHLNGGYAAMREQIYLPAYTPGWRLALLLPWQIDGAMVPGRSAGAAFVLHAGLAALLFDIVRREAADSLAWPRFWVAAAAWLVVLIYLSAQGTGTLWTYILLVEQPQIYFYAGVGFLLFSCRPDSDPPANIWFHIGLAVLGGYLIKSATLAIMPGLLLAAMWIAWQRRAGISAESRGSALRSCALLFGPVLSAAILWRLSVPDVAQGCLASPLATLTPSALSEALGRDWTDLGVRFGSAVAGYVVGYKTPVLLIATIGLVAACMQKRAAAVIALGGFAAIYLILLYWYHLSCFGDFYFTRLNSIERFTRVVLQPLHALGLLAFATGAIHLAARRGGAALVGSAPVRAGWVVAIIAMAGYQAHQVDRSLEDVSTRRHQAVDPRIAEVRAAAEFVKTHYGSAGKPPLIQFVSQGTDSDIIGYAKFFSSGKVHGRPAEIFRTSGEVSWSRGDPANHWQQRRSEKSLVRLLKSADIIWPITVDPWLRRLLAGLASPDAACAGAVERKVLVKRPGGDFKCLPKSDIEK